MSYKMEIPQQEQEITHLFLSIALGGHSFLHPYIEECYRKNEWEFYEAYQGSSLKGNPLFSTYTTKSEEKIRQAAGIIEWSNQNQQFHHVDYLIKKGYKFVFQYLQQHHQIEFEHFMRNFAKRQKSKPVKEIELIYQNIVLWYLCVRENRFYNTKSVAWKSFQKVLYTSLNDMRMQEVMFSKTACENHRDEIDRLYEEYKIPQNIRFDSLGVFLEFMISSNVKNTKETNPHCDMEWVEQHVFQVSPTKFIGALGGWLKTLGIHELDATEQIPFTKEDLDRVFMEILYAQKYNCLTKEEQDLFFITCLYQQCLSSLYLETKTLYLDQSKEDFYLRIRAKEARINEQEAHLLRKQQEWRFTYKRQQKEIEGLTEDLRAANARIRQLGQQLENMEDFAEEVHALRNFVYREEEEDDHPPSLFNMVEFIQSKNIVLFGGSLNWQLKLKEILPTIKFINAGEKNRDISKIQRVDAVFINTTVFAHAFYKKIMKELSLTQTPLFYLTGQRNMDKTILEIYKWLTE
ncbi:hypothetical protein [Neobacillus sp. Marseille-QA0830]